MLRIEQVQILYLVASVHNSEILCFSKSKVKLLGHQIKKNVNFWNGYNSYNNLARARAAVPLGLWSITSSLRGNLYVPRLHKFIKWFADNDVAHRN